MLLFNWQKIVEQTDYSASKIIKIIEMLYYDRLPYSKSDPNYRFSTMDFSGQSFLLNPKDLLQSQHIYTEKEIAVYVGLAARRKLSEYLAFNKISLSYVHAPEAAKTLKQNSLLRIEGDNITFKFEEAYLDELRRNKNGSIVQ